MQYKIPVQIENEDPILLGLSLKQLTVIMIGFGLAYMIFTSLQPRTWAEIAAIPAGAIGIITVLIAVFKQYEMTFIPFVLALLRKNIFPSERHWQWGVDSHQPMDIGYITDEEQKKQENIDIWTRIDSINELQEKLKKI